MLILETMRKDTASFLGFRLLADQSFGFMLTIEEVFLCQAQLGIREADNSPDFTLIVQIS